jgi:hypothetical protein
VSFVRGLREVFERAAHISDNASRRRDIIDQRGWS